jgi:PAS domain S-box-containing protein
MEQNFNWISAGWNTSKVGFLCMDLSGRITAINPRIEELFSTPANAITGRTIFDFVDPYSRQKTQTMIDLSLSEGGVKDWELDIMVANSIPILIGFTTSLIENDAHEMIGIMAVCQDMTEKTELTARLATTNQQLEGTLLKLEKAHQDLKNAQVQLIQSEKMRSLGQMVAGIAHEINNPVGFVSNNLTFLQEKVKQLLTFCQQAGQDSLPELEPLPDYFWPDIEAAISESIEGTVRITDIVKALRNFSRLDEADFKKVDLIEGLQSTLQIVKATHKQHVVFVEDFQPIPEINCNPSMLNQVLMNLLINAADAIPRQGLVTIRTRYAEEKIIIEVEDTGTGMDAETISHLGEPFFTTKPVGSGTGLGLAISYGIIQRHQGKLEFESKPGKGTLARLIIPTNLEHLQG